VLLRGRLAPGSAWNRLSREGTTRWAHLVQAVLDDGRCTDAVNDNDREAS